MPFGSWWMKQKTHLLAHVEISAAFGASSSSPRSHPGRRVSRSECCAPARSMVSRNRSSPPWNWKSMTSRMTAPLRATMRSPTSRPAAAAGVLPRTAATTTPSAEERGFMRGRVPLVAGRRVQVAHALHEVLQAGNDGEGRRQPHRDLEGERHPEVARGETEQHGGDLKEGGGLARPRRSRIDAPAHHVDEQ